jgi:hypothetical protein
VDRTKQDRRDRSALLVGRSAWVVPLSFLLLSLFDSSTSAAVSPARTGRSSTDSWKLEEAVSPDREKSAVNELSSVSCSSARACTAVGSRATSLSNSGTTLVERWVHGSWSVQSTLLPAGAKSAALDGVSCPSASFCAAVGQTISFDHRAVPLTELWHGSSWAIKLALNPPGSSGANLKAVSCNAPTACMAVGFYDSGGAQVAMSDRWDGTRWTEEALLGAASTTLNAVSCTAATVCTAVGSKETPNGALPLALHWNGTTWRPESVPLPSSSSSGLLSAVSCSSRNLCMATGANLGPGDPTLAERWDGTRWRVQVTPAPPGSSASMQELDLNSVSCPSTTSCTASGAYAPGGVSAYFLETWQKGSWKLISAPHPAAFRAGAINAVSCAPSHCAAVGGWSGGPIYIAALGIGT